MLSSSDSEWEVLPPGRGRAPALPKQPPASGRKLNQQAPTSATSHLPAVPLATEARIRALLSAAASAPAAAAPGPKKDRKSGEISDHRLRQNLAIVFRRREIYALAALLPTMSAEISGDAAETALHALRKIPQEISDQLLQAAPVEAEPERSVRKLLRVDRVFLRLELCVLRSEIAENIGNFQRRRLALLEASEKIRASAELKLLRSLALKLGNLIDGETSSQISISVISGFKTKKFPIQGRRVSAFELLVDELRAGIFDFRKFLEELAFSEDFSDFPDQVREFQRWTEDGLRKSREFGDERITQTLLRAEIGNFNAPSIIAEFGGRDLVDLVNSVVALKKDLAKHW